MEVLIFILGTVIGSFLNVCIYRIPLNQSIAYPPSHCPNCNNRLNALDLIPIISFLFARGKCKYCNEKISYQYPLVEIFNGLAYLLLYIKFGYSLLFIQYSILSSILIVIAIIDYHHQIIPNTINTFVFIFALIFHIISFNGFSNLFQYLLGLVVGGGFLLLIAIVSKGGMGGGDIKLMTVLGFWLGLRSTILILFLSFFIGGILSVIFIALKLKDRKDMIAFGPFIVLATLVTVFYGDNIINYYISTFLNY